MIARLECGFNPWPDQIKDFSVRLFVSDLPYQLTFQDKSDKKTQEYTKRMGMAFYYIYLKRKGMHRQEKKFNYYGNDGSYYTTKWWYNNLQFNIWWNN